MSKWKATMPRALPADGKVDVVFAQRGAAGSRMEIHGEFDKNAVGRLFGEMTRLAAGKAPAESTAPSTHVFTVKQLDDEHVEYSLNGVHLITANHEDDGWAGMERIGLLVNGIAASFGATVQEVES